MGKLQGKVAVVTGGTTGIGFATAKRFVDEGAYVFITGRRQKELDEAVKAIGSNVAGVRGDVSKLQDLDRLYETVKAEGKVDVLVAIAGMPIEDAARRAAKTFAYDNEYWFRYSVLARLESAVAQRRGCSPRRRSWRVYIHR